MAVSIKRLESENSNSSTGQPVTILFGPEQLDRVTLQELNFSTSRFLPPYHLVPEPFKLGQTKWNRLFQTGSTAA